MWPITGMIRRIVNEEIDKRTIEMERLEIRLKGVTDQVVLNEKASNDIYNKIYTLAESTKDDIRLIGENGEKAVADMVTEVSIKLETYGEMMATIMRGGRT